MTVSAAVPQRDTGSVTRPEPAGTPEAETVDQAPPRGRTGVVVVSYRSHELVRANVDRDLPEDVVVVVVDNFSTVHERRAIGALARERGWRLVLPSDNAGFGAGVNAGVAEALRAGCDCVVLLNPDARVPSHVLLELARECRDDPMTMAAPRLVDSHGVPHFHGSEVELGSGRIRGLRAPRETAEGWVLGDSRIDGGGQPWLSAACLAMHRRLFTLLGGLDERYFLYWEDVDLSYRAALHGARLVVRPHLVGVHDAGGTQGARRGRALSGRYYYFNARNRLRFAARHLSRGDVLRWLVSTPAVSYEILLRGGRKQLLTSPVPALSIAAGALAGTAHGVRALARPPDRRPAVRQVRPAPLRVTVAMLTFHRPDDLAEALPRLLEQCAEVTDVATDVEIVVVDNDPAGSGAAVVSGMRTPRTRCVVETRPGIANARNRALEECADRDVLVFIDDDERPHEGWLRHLLEVYRSTGADVVSGPVVSAFPGPMDPWVAAGAFFRRRRLRTGSPITVAATNNLLLDLAVVRGAGLRFDPRFGLCGVGEDTLLTLSLARRGARLVWCDEAVVTDVVPAGRMSRAWVLRRALSMGSVASITHVALHPTATGRAAARIAAVLRGTVRCVVGGGRAGLGVVLRSAQHEARGLRTLVRGAGMIVGAAGVMCQQYDDGGAQRTRFVRFTTGSGRPA